MISSVRLTRAGLAYANLHEEHYAFVGRSDRVARNPLRGAPDASNHVLIDTATSLPLFRYFLDALDRPEMWSFAETELVGTIAAVRYRILAGAGVGVLPLYFVKPELDQKDLVELVPDARPKGDMFRLVWRTGDARDSEMQQLADELRKIPLQ
jgi:DNA-binding transcriptional LysR family regulator